MMLGNAFFRILSVDLKVRLGEWDTQSEEDHPSLKHSDYGVQRIVYHPHYQATNVWNDVALLFLNDTVKLNYHINTICLPEEGEVFHGETCYASGWGKDNFGE